MQYNYTYQQMMTMLLNSQHHRLCPKGAHTWCRYQLALSKGTPVPQHPYYLSQDAAKLVAKVFTDFGYNTANFIEKVQEGHTSNHNEALHSILWTMVHNKNEYSSSENMSMGAALTVIRYNDGYEGIRKLFEILHLPISTPLTQKLFQNDRKRLSYSHRILSEQQKYMQRSSGASSFPREFHPPVNFFSWCVE